MCRHSGKTIWIMGIPLSGKTTIGVMLYEWLIFNGWDVEHLDGDVIRKSLCDNLGFSKEDRLENIKRIRFLCNLLNKHSVCTIVSLVTPYQEMRDDNRKYIKDYTEIWLNASLDTCLKRDNRYVYDDSGKMKTSTGFGKLNMFDLFDLPKNPDVICYTDKETVEESMEKILKYIFRKRWEIWETIKGKQ